MRRAPTAVLASPNEKVQEEEAPQAASQLIARLQKGLERLLHGAPEQTMDQARLDEMATIIKTYRGLGDADDNLIHYVWVDDIYFSVFMSLIIVLNAVVITLRADMSTYAGAVDWHWLMFDCVFCFLFVMELVLKLRYHGWRWLLTDLWNFVTFALTVAMLVDVAVLLPLEIYTPLKIITLVRCFGLVRLRHIIDTSHRLEELRILVRETAAEFRLSWMLPTIRLPQELKAIWDGVAAAGKVVGWVIVLLLGLVYMSAIFLTKEIGQNYEVYGNYSKLSGGWDHDEKFGTMGRSMYTLMQVITLDGWSSKIVRHIIANQTYMGIFFAVFLLLSTYGTMNIVVAVIVQQIVASAEKNKKKNKTKEERRGKAELESIAEVFRMTDKDNTGTIEREEFLKASQDPKVMWRMRAMQLPVEDAAKLFEVLDGDGSRGLTQEEFTEGCKKLKGPAMSKDLLSIHAQADIIAKRMETLRENLTESERMMTALDEVTNRLCRRFEPSLEGARRKIAASVGGSKPMVPPPRVGPGGNSGVSLATGNLPTLPQFPDMLH